MAYKLPQLIKENYDFSNLVPTEQADVQNKLSVAFNLSDIVTYIQKGTNNFRVENPIAVDLDNEIYKIAIDKGQGQPEPKGEEPMPTPTPEGGGGKFIDGVFVSDFALKEFSKEQIKEWVEAVNTILEYTTEEDRTEDQKEALFTITEYLASTE